MRLRVALIVGFLVATHFVSAVLAASDAETGWGWIETIGRWFNLFLLFGFIYYFTREPIARFFQDRRRAIRQEIREAQQARDEAERKLAAIEVRMSRLDQELEQLRVQAEAEAEKEKERIRNQAEEEAERIVAATQREIDGLTRAAIQELRQHAAELSVKMATEKIVTGMDRSTQDRVIERFFVKLTTGGEKN